MNNKLSVNDISPQGKRGVLVQLLPYPNQADKTDSGLYMPKYKTYETDGGRPAARIDKEKYSLVGKILKISSAAQSLMQKEEMDYKVGDTISIISQAKNQTNWLILDKLQSVADFTGLVLVTPEHLECKILTAEPTDNNNNNTLENENE